MKQKTFIEVNCIYNIHIGEKSFCICYFSRSVRRLGSDRLKNLKFTLVLQTKVHFKFFNLSESPFISIEKRRPIKYCLCGAKK